MTTLAILRTKDKKEESIRLAEESGFSVRFASPLELRELESPAFWEFVDEVERGGTQRAIMTNPNAVKFMFQLLAKKDKGSSVLKRLNQKGIIAIGPLTAEAAKQQWIKAETIPDKFTAEGLGNLLKGKISPGEKVWVIRSDKEGEVLRKGLEMMGAMVGEAPVYSLQRTVPDRALLDIYYWTVNGGIDAYAFTSPNSVQVFVEEGEKKYGVREFGQALNSSIIAAINESTKGTLEGLGINVDVVPKEATFEKMISSLQIYLAKNP